MKKSYKNKALREFIISDIDHFDHSGIYSFFSNKKIISFLRKSKYFSPEI
jgi:hypothetical protein